MDGPGTMSWEEFVENAESIIEISNAIDDHWQFEGDKVRSLDDRSNTTHITQS